MSPNLSGSELKFYDLCHKSNIIVKSFNNYLKYRILVIKITQKRIL